MLNAKQYAICLGGKIMLDKIYNIFSERPAGIIGNYKKSAVMILLAEKQGETFVVFEERAHTLRHQPGDICLPGGKLEEGETPKVTAIRETLEELSLELEDIEYIGEMDYFISPYGSIMYPFIAKLLKQEIEPNEYEVDHVFYVPLKFFLQNEPLLYNMEIGPHLNELFPYHLIKGGKDYKFSRGTLNQYFYEYDNHVIWGFTAMVVKSFIDILKRES